MIIIIIIIIIHNNGDNKHSKDNDMIDSSCDVMLAWLRFPAPRHLASFI